MSKRLLRVCVPPPPDWVMRDCWLSLNPFCGSMIRSPLTATRLSWAGFLEISEPSNFSVPKGASYYQ